MYTPDQLQITSLELYQGRPYLEKVWKALKVSGGPSNFCSTISQIYAKVLNLKKKMAKSAHLVQNPPKSLKSLITYSEDPY